MGYKLYVRDQYFNRVAEIDDFQKFEMILRFNALGAWVLDLPIDCVASKELIKPQAGIIVINDGNTVFSGKVINRNRQWNANNDRLTVSGVDDSIWLVRGLAYPETNGNFSLKDYDVRTGVAETIMKQYVDFNIGSQAKPERRISNLIIEADKGLGMTVTGSARFHSLMELLTSLSLAGGDIGFRTIQVNKNIEFQVYQPTDKTKEVVFSPLLGNLREFEYTLEDPETNYVLVGGGGEGTERIILERGDSVSISEYGRIETFVDQRNTSDNTELTQALDEELTQKSIKSSLTISPVDTESVIFGRDYNLGDKVSIVLTQPNEIVEIETLYYFLSAYQTGEMETTRVRKIQEKLQVIQDVIREVKITIDPNGVSITPLIGTPDSLSKQGAGIFNRMKKLTKRLSSLERR